MGVWLGRGEWKICETQVFFPLATKIVHPQFGEKIDGRKIVAVMD